MNLRERNLILSEIKKNFKEPEDSIAITCGEQYIIGRIMEEAYKILRYKGLHRLKNELYMEIIHWAIRGIYATGRDAKDRESTEGVHGV